MIRAYEAFGALRPSRIVQGCMRIANLSDREADTLVHTALDAGVNVFDHADIYGKGGGAEEVFGRVLARNPGMRQRMLLQSKCGIRRTFYDFSKEHILYSVDESLRRLGVEQLDILLLHRPDTLMEPEEVAEAFDVLEESGKVRAFGVSNHHPLQIELLKTCVRQPLLFHQLQFGLAHTNMVDVGINVNTSFPEAIDRDGGVLEHARIQGLTIQAWSPFQQGFMEGVFWDHPDFAPLCQTLRELAGQYGAAPSAVAIAWILRHPAAMQAVIGTTNPARVREIAQATSITLSRPDWYALYRAAGHKLP